MIHFNPEDEKRGLIRVDSEKGKQLGLTSDRSTEDSYLWLDGDTLWLSMLISKQEHKGHVHKIMKKAVAKGYNLGCVPVSARMEHILRKFGFEQKDDFWYYNNKAVKRTLESPCKT